MVEQHGKKLTVLHLYKMQVTSAKNLSHQSLDKRRKTELKIWMTAKAQLFLTIIGSRQMHMLWMKSWLH